ncbi:tRNA (mnm(5)s(2)U34)-methyltransferase [Abyssisolibacter fermentans]|uniref:tRNA (mnm(5)s(2)U34)-methyltransferase n=1 Tax=Abyssisolibacter fermentans TaxID=1766203 RepID=UPI00083143F8|nr:class I SAM-dependent methyltransferase [Abyssisolibacter fermentans]
MEQFNNAITIAKNIMQTYVKAGQTVVDTTMGNGNDTKLLASLIQNDGKVYAFDIQLEAIENTKKLLEDNSLLDRTILINDSHSKIDEYIKENIDFAVFNLGYLPTGDHKVITKPDSTILALEQCLNKLNKNGIVLITMYYSHDGGLEEKIAIEDFLKSLSQKKYNVAQLNFINQVNNPPILCIIEKRKNN